MASDGKASSSARSELSIVMQARSGTSSAMKGTVMWRRMRWRRQLHRVQSAIGPEGQQNQASRLSKGLMRSSAWTRQAQALKAQAASTASVNAPSSQTR
mmetsp:Transcript_59136/g.145151  ORF Transcript_59136/g.145151 Transcript_59136/m.145151 type:complete len:99 (+) Transcript_59136:745-1041(+)